MRTLLRLAVVCGYGLVVAAHDGAEQSLNSGSGGNKLALILPNLYGSAGLVLPNQEHTAHFDSAFRESFGPFNASLASQLTSQPIPSPASGFIYTFDKTLGVATRSAQSFGPILAERAETIGKDKFFFGFASQFFRFNSIDGVDLSRISAVFQHQPTPNPVFGDDFITTENFLDLNIGQFTGYFTYGLTDRIDLSVAVPMVSASFNVISRATIQRVGTGDDRSVHFFQSGDGTTAQFSGAASASGLGDIMTRIKGTVMRTPRAALAAGLDLRVPTGDEYNFLGSGAAGLKPFVVMSFKAGRVSPHLNGAFQWNGKSVLAGNVAMGDKRKLPNEISFIAGADIGLSPKLTVAADILGLRRENAQRLTSTPFQAANGAFYNNIAFRRGGLSQYNGAVGFKINGTGNLLLAFNLLFKLNNDGLRGRVIPLISLSYSL